MFLCQSPSQLGQDWFNSSHSGLNIIFIKHHTPLVIRIRPGGDPLQIPPHCHTRQVRVLLQGTRHQSHEIRRRGESEGPDGARPSPFSCQTTTFLQGRSQVFSLDDLIHSA